MAITLSNITSGFNTALINANFQKVEDYINDKLLARAATGVAGEAMMERDLDMNGFRILNADLDSSSITNDRAIRVSVGEAPLDPLPDVDTRKGKMLGFDPDDGLPAVFVPVSGSAADVLMQLAASTGATLVGAAGGGTVQSEITALKAGTNIAYRNYTMKARLDEELSIASVAGVDKTGVADSTAALQAFFNSLPDGSEVYVPPGTYKVGPITIANNSLKIRGAYQYAYGQSTTKFKAASAGITMFTFTGNGCKLENLLFEGFEATSPTNDFGVNTTCTLVDFQPSNAGGDIDSFVNNCIFFYCQTGLKGTGRNLTVTNNLFTFNRFPVDLYYKSGQQFRGHVIDNNRFHSCGGPTAATEPTIANSVCIRLTTNTAAGTLADNYAGNISIRNNVSDGGCYQFFSGPLHRGSIMANNSMFRMGGANAICIKIDNTPTVANTEYDGFAITGNVIHSDLTIAVPQQFPDYGLYITAARGGMVSGNAFSKFGKHGVVLDNCADLVVADIQIKNPNMNVAANGVTFNAIEIPNGGNNLQLLNINVRNTQSNPQIQYVVNVASATNVMIDNVQANNYSAQFNEGASARVHGALNFGSIRRKEVYATATSTLTTGNYAVGDICWFTQPITAGFIGAVCQTAGTGAAAVWRNFGAVV